MPRWTSLASAGNWVHHTEHILAAIALCGIDNMLVEMDTDRIPMMPGGTCTAFVAAMRNAGRSPSDALRQVYRLKGPAFLLDAQTPAGMPLDDPPLQGGRHIMALPADRLSVSTVFHWTHMDELPIGVAEFEFRDSTSNSSIIDSRSYLVESEKTLVRNLLGPAQHTLMILYPGCPTALAQEAARHKIVDFIGDMMVLGRPLHGRFAIFRAGHRIHHDFLRQLLSHNLLDLQATQE